MGGRTRNPNFVFAQNPEEYERFYRSLRLGRWKYIEDDQGRKELYDLSQDPGELNNLVKENEEMASFLRLNLTQGMWATKNTKQAEEID